MSDPFVIPKLINPYALSVDDCWAERKTTGIHLIKYWGKLTLINAALGSMTLLIMHPPMTSQVWSGHGP
jgi:hypothetical protein